MKRWYGMSRVRYRGLARNACHLPFVVAYAVRRAALREKSVAAATRSMRKQSSVGVTNFACNPSQCALFPAAYNALKSSDQHVSPRLSFKELRAYILER